MRNYLHRFLLACILSIVVVIVHAQQNAPQLGKNSIQEIIAAMTLEEKVNILVGGGMNMPGLPLPGASAEPAQ